MTGWPELEPIVEGEPEAGLRIGCEFVQSFGVVFCNKAASVPGTVEGTPVIRVLLADDHRDIVEMLRFAFSVYGAFEVVGVAGDGKRAVDLAIDLQPDVAVVDLMMPALSGFDAIPLIRSGAPATRIVVLSAVDDARSRRLALEAGADLYLVKGVLPREMARMLGELVMTGPAIQL
jgi:DNA-binding NarL/FixJ family response regulator